MSLAVKSVSLPVFTLYLADAIGWKLESYHSFFLTVKFRLINQCCCCVLLFTYLVELLWSWHELFIYVFILWRHRTTSLKLTVMQSENSTRCKAVFADLQAFSRFSWGFFGLFAWFFWKWFCLSVKAFERFHEINSKGVNRKAAVFLI